MTHDYEVARKVWEAHVPVEILVETTNNTQRSFFIMIPRCSYFGLQLQRILQYFANYDDCIELEPSNLALDCMGQLIRTYFPVGVLYDMLKSQGSDILSLNLRVKKEGELGIVQKDVLESMFMQAVKEADYLKRKAEVITSMKSEDHHQLWSGVAHYRFDDFWSINRRLMENNGNKSFLHCPIRFYETDQPFKQVPLRPQTDSGEPVILRDALATVFPDTDLSTREIVSHGIRLPLDTPLTYLCTNLSYPDNFVHVVIT